MSSMSLIVSVIDKVKSEPALKSEDTILFLLDDPFDLVMQKLNLLGYLNIFTKLEFKYNGSFLPITNSFINYQLTEINNKSEFVVYVSELITLLPDLYTQSQMVEMLITNKIQDVFESIINLGYTELNIEALEFAIKFNLKDDISLAKQMNITDEYIDTFVSQFDIENDLTIDSQNPFYKFAQNLTFDNLDIESITWNNVDFTINGTSSFKNKNIVKIQSIFNTLELSPEIPFIALSKKQNIGSTLDSPLIKIYNGLINTVDQKEIKSWVLNEKKKLNEASYKIIKGLLVKSKLNTVLDSYLTINIMPSGIFHVNASIPGDFNLAEITDLVLGNLDSIITLINTLGGINLPLTAKSIITMTTFDAIITTNFYIDRNSLARVLNEKNTLKYKFFEVKNTDGTDFTSLNYLRDSKYNSLNQKFTINIKDSQFVKDSSIVTLFGAHSELQINTILTELLIYSNIQSKKGTLVFNEIQKKRKIKEKSKKKILKESGVNFDSRTCQGNRIPELVSTQEPGTLVVNKKKNGKIESKIYKCNDEYIYPGFTKFNTVCCFKNNQVGDESFIRNINPESLEILVQPSNKKITISLPTLKKTKNFITYALKMYDSPYKADFFYIGPTNQLTEITDLQLINSLNLEQNYWLEPTPLSHILYPGSSKDCSNQPNLFDRTTINSPCNKYSDSTIFGYNSKSTPCCFDKERPEQSFTKIKKIDYSKVYILLSDKLLNNEKIGKLPDTLLSVFAKLNTKNSGTFSRMGVLQNANSFLNAVILAQQSKLGIYAFKQTIIDNLTQVPGMYITSNLGNTAVKYGELNNFISAINSNTVHYIDLIDIIEKILNINIIVLGEKSIICRTTLTLPKKESIILLYTKIKGLDDTPQSSFELVVNITNGNLTTIFQNTLPIIKFLNEYTTDSCIKEVQLPENYIFTQLPEFTTIQNVDIKYQIVNPFNKTNLLMSKSHILIPIVETGIINNIDTLNYTELLELNSLKTVASYKDIVIATVPSDIPDITGGVTIYNVVIPCKSDSVAESKLPKYDYTYYFQIDNALYNPDTTSNSKNYHLDQEFVTDTLEKIKTIIAYRLSSSTSNYPKAKEFIISTQQRDDLSRTDKINAIVIILKQLSSINRHINITPGQIDFYLQTIANEILNDNIENLLLNNIVAAFNKNEIVKRPEESILLNIPDIYNWIQQRTIL